MKRPESIVAEIRRFCRSNASEEVVRKGARYFREGYDAYGVDFPLMLQQRDLLLERYGEALGLDGFLNLGDLLVRNGKYEEGSFAILFIAAFRKSFRPATFRRLGKWLEGGLDNWAHTDFLCGEVLSRFLLEGIIPMDAVASWRHSPSKWKRRAAAVMLVKPMKAAAKAGAPVDTYLEFVAPLMEDKERVVQQGLGWLLREAWKKQPGPVEESLMTWKERCGRTVVQYATERMPAARKADFKRLKTSPRKPR